MGFCFYKFGILPREYMKLNDTDKILMLAALDYYNEKEKKAMDKKK